MKIGIEQINSEEIRDAMRQDYYKSAELIGTYRHPKHKSENKFEIRLLRAADQLVVETTAFGAIWEGTHEFEQMVMEYGLPVQLLP